MGHVLKTYRRWTIGHCPLFSVALYTFYNKYIRCSGVGGSIDSKMRRLNESIDTGYLEWVCRQMRSLLLLSAFYNISSCGKWGADAFFCRASDCFRWIFSLHNWAEIMVSINGSDIDSFRFNWNGTNNSIYDHSLVLKYNLDNNSALGENVSTVIDISPERNNGRIHGAFWNSSGRFGAAIQFSGDDYISVPDDAGLNFTDSFTLAAWLDILPDSVIQITIGSSHSCALLSGGYALCWGENTYGQLGDGTNISRSIPVPVSGGYNYTMISAGDAHTCGLLGNGSVLCWGYNEHGSLGSGTLENSLFPVYVSGVYNFSYIDAGYHTCGVLVNKTAMCWGPNNKGQLGDGTNISRSIPVPVSGGYNYTMISAGYVHTCGLLGNGSVLCWGYNEYGSLGNGSAGASVPSPVYVAGGYNFSHVRAGMQYSCGVLSNGSGMCWGKTLLGNWETA